MIASVATSQNWKKNKIKIGITGDMIKVQMGN
jgi:hypothetical protein